MGKNILGALVGVGFLLGTLSPAAAHVNITISDYDGVVVVLTDGSINLGAVINYVGLETLDNPYLIPAYGVVATGSGSVDVYGLNLYDWASFGPSFSTINGMVFAGDAFALVPGGLGLTGGIALPAGYVSNRYISSLATFTGTVASLGLVPGEYFSSFNSGAVTDSVLVKVLATVPEPGWTGLLVAGGLLAVVGCRQARRPSPRPA